jgi:outer membrane protein OmpA-like peptidoglycan-associated protein
MKNWILILLGLAGVGALTYLCATHHRPAIETDLTTRTRDALAKASLTGIDVGADGQYITLRGEVPDQESKDRAEREARAIWGVNDVRNLLTVRAAPVMTQEKREAVNCQEQFNTLLNDPIRFATNSTVVDRASYPLLDKLAAAAKLCPSAEIEIGGHTDSRGSTQLNTRLSQGRANAVLAYLQKKGIDRKRLTAVGYGPSKPVADNATPEGMEKNRRTEFQVKGL